MLEQHQLNPSLICSETSQSPHVVSEFDIEKGHCIIVSVGRIPGLGRVQEILSAFLNDLNFSKFSEIAQFEVKGELCVIVGLFSDNAEPDCDCTALLTARELQVATMVAQGQPNKQIAKQLHISEWTVATYLRRIFAKLNVDSRAAMVYRCADWIHRWQKANVVESKC